MNKKLSKKNKKIELNKQISFRSEEENKEIAQKLIKKFFPDQIGKKIKYKPIHNGYTNFSYLVTFQNKAQFQIRIPHKGDIINREVEYDLLHNYLANEDFIYYDNKTGIAIKKWIKGKCPKSITFHKKRLLDNLFHQIRNLHKLTIKKNSKFKPIKFDQYNENLYRLKFTYQKKFLCLIDRRNKDEIVINHSDINPQNIIYNKQLNKLTLIDYEWVGLASDYFDYANFIRETGINYKNIDWFKYIEDFNMEILEHYIFMSSIYSYLWTYSMPQTKKIIKYRAKSLLQIRKYYPGVINVDKSCYVEHETKK